MTSLLSSDRLDDGLAPIQVRLAVALVAHVAGVGVDVARLRLLDPDVARVVVEAGFVDRQPVSLPHADDVFERGLVRDGQRVTESPGGSFVHEGCGGGGS